MARPSVLFVGHGGERTGPPMFLANFQRWLATQGAFPGGMVEFVSKGSAGLVIPYPELDRFADSIVALANDEPRRAKLAASASIHARAHHLTNVAAPRLLATVEALLTQSSR